MDMSELEAMWQNNEVAKPKVRCPMCHVEADYLGLKGSYACPKCNSSMHHHEEEGIVEMWFCDDTLETIKRPTPEELAEAMYRTAKGF